MNYIDILTRSLRTLLFNLSIKVEENPNDTYIKGMLEGVRMADSLVSAWEMETDNLTDLLESKQSLPDGKIKN